MDLDEIGGGGKTLGDLDEFGGDKNPEKLDEIEGGKTMGKGTKGGKILGAVDEVGRRGKTLGELDEIEGGKTLGMGTK